MAYQNINQYNYRRWGLIPFNQITDFCLASDERDYNEEVVFSPLLIAENDGNRMPFKFDFDSLETTICRNCDDFDIETLTELEDLLDSYGGTLIVVSHDRYFLERVCDRFVGLLGDGALRDLPRGVDQYLEQRLDALSSNKSTSTNKATSNAAEQRQLKKDVARLEKQLLKLDEAINALVEEQSTAAFDAERLIEISAKLEELRADKNTKEEEWLFATTALDN